MTIYIAACWLWGMLVWLGCFYNKSLMATTYENWAQLFYNISPYSWAYVGIGIALGASVIGAAWYSNIHQGASTFREPPSWEPQ